MALLRGKKLLVIIEINVMHAGFHYGLVYYISTSNIIIKTSDLLTYFNPHTMSGI